MICKFCGKEFVSSLLPDGYVESYGEYCSPLCLSRAFGLGVNG